MKLGVRKVSNENSSIRSRISYCPPKDSGVGFEPTSLSTQGYEPCNLPLVIP